MAEILLHPVPESKRPPYWNFTSGFTFDLSTVIGMWFCIGLPDFMQIKWSPSDLWYHINFTIWRPYRRKSNSRFWFGHVSQSHYKKV